MSEPAYAALLFDQVCAVSPHIVRQHDAHKAHTESSQLCSASPARWVDYAIRLRLCKSCHSTKYVATTFPETSDE